MYSIQFSSVGQSYPTLCDPKNSSMPGLPVHHQLPESTQTHVQLVAILWTVAHQAPPSMGFFRQEYWSRLPFPSAGDLPHSGIEPGSPGSPALQVGSLPAEPPGKPSLALRGPHFLAHGLFFRLCSQLCWAEPCS